MVSRLWWPTLKFYPGIYWPLPFHNWLIYIIRIGFLYYFIPSTTLNPIVFPMRSNIRHGSWTFNMETNTRSICRGNSE